MSRSGGKQRSRPLRSLVVAGARPNFMKVAPLLRRMHAREDFEPILVHTGQHYDAVMSDGFFRDLGIPEPEFNLGVGSGSHAEQTGQVLIKIEQLILRQARKLERVILSMSSTYRPIRAGWLSPARGVM